MVTLGMPRNGANSENAARISVWIAAMLPVCRSPQMHARFPLFPDDLDDLMTAAYGSVAGPDQLADYEDLLGDGPRAPSSPRPARIRNPRQHRRQRRYLLVHGALQRQGVLSIPTL